MLQLQVPRLKPEKRGCRVEAGPTTADEVEGLVCGVKAISDFVLEVGVLQERERIDETRTTMEEMEGWYIVPRQTSGTGCEC